MTAWHPAGLYDCELVCGTNEKTKSDMGCYGEAGGVQTFPPASVQYEGKRVKTRLCPVRHCTPDVLELFRSRRLADGRLTLAEQDTLPTAYIEAWEIAGEHIGLAQAERARKKK